MPTITCFSLRNVSGETMYGMASHSILSTMARAKASLEASECGAFLLFDFYNIRYTTQTWIGGALGARSGAELAVLTADLPGGLAAPPPPAREAQLSKEVRDGLRVIGSLYLIATILWLSAVLAGHDTVGATVSFTAVMATMVALFASLHGVAVLVSARRFRELGAASLQRGGQGRPA